MENEINGVPSNVRELPVLDLQPLINRIAETADIGTVVLILIIGFLIAIIISERSRNATLTQNYMNQSLEVVKVLTSVKELMNTNVRYLENNETVVRTISDRLHELSVSVQLRMPKPTKRSRRKPKSEEAVSSADSEGRDL